MQANIPFIPNQWSFLSMAYYPYLWRWTVQLLVVVLAVSATLVRASYYMDDRDSRITYAPATSWSSDTNSLDTTKLYNGTRTLGNCNTSFNCTMTIPFNGPGIALYALVAEAITFTITIDGGTPTNHHFDGVWGCCNATISPAYNFEIYRASSLSHDNHVLLVTLLDSVVGYNLGVPHSVIYFDYAIVNNDTNVNPTSSASPTGTSSKSVSRSVIGPAVGGAIGGIVVISAIVFALFCVRRRTQRRDTVAINPDPHAPMLDVEHAHIVGASQLPSSNDTPSSIAQVEVAPLTSVFDQPPQPPPKPTASSDPRISRSSPLSPATPPLSTPLTETIMSPMIDPIPSPSTQNPTDTADSALATEEVRFLRDLYSRNVPPDEITGLIQVMRERRQVTSGVAGASGQAGNTAPGSAPPAYDFTT